MGRVSVSSGKSDGVSSRKSECVSSGKSDGVSSRKSV